MSLDRIHILDLSIMGIVGIKPNERVTPQEVLVNLTMWVDSRPAAASDDIADAANYRTVSKAIIAHIETGEPMLVERLAQELADVVFEVEPRCREVEVRVEKPGALRHARSVGITIHRSRVTPT
jgi:dihydroneopterin aldolase/D-erythro-7,8-dihydroneopterin triphosphate epimerase